MSMARAFSAVCAWLPIAYIHVHTHTPQVLMEASFTYKIMVKNVTLVKKKKAKKAHCFDFTYRALDINSILSVIQRATKLFAHPIFSVNYFCNNFYLLHIYVTV